MSGGALPPVTHSVDLFSMIQRIPGVPSPLKKSLPYSYANSPFVDCIALVEMSKKFHFPNMKLYSGTIDHITSYNIVVSQSTIIETI